MSTVAANLQQAAGLAYDNVHAKSLLSQQLRHAMETLCFDLFPLFPDSAPNGRPFANWLTVFNATAITITTVRPSIVQTQIVAEQLYKLCWLADALRGLSQISASQATAILASYNTRFG
jgi:hypothetical protein